MEPRERRRAGADAAWLPREAAVGGRRRHATVGDAGVAGDASVEVGDAGGSGRAGGGQGESGEESHRHPRMRDGGARESGEEAHRLRMRDGGARGKARPGRLNVHAPRRARRAAGCYDVAPMRVIVYGATGMVGQGVLRECLEAPDVEAVLVVGRGPCGVTDPKVTELVRTDLLDYAGVEARLQGCDACFFCLGVSSAGLSEADYQRVTYDFTLAAARALLAQSPDLTFVFVSGEGADSTERGRTMWARVKGKAENAILALGFKRAYVFRPAFIEALHGIKSRTRSYRVLYVVLRPLLPLLRRAMPDRMTTTVNMGRAMLNAARRGAPKAVLRSKDINELAA